MYDSAGQLTQNNKTPLPTGQEQNWTPTMDTQLQVKKQETEQQIAKQKLIISPTRQGETN